MDTDTKLKLAVEDYLTKMINEPERKEELRAFLYGFIATLYSEGLLKSL